jgi:outer membrane protein TolC
LSLEELRLEELIGRSQVKKANNSRWPSILFAVSVVPAALLASAPLSAQISLSTVVSLAQRNSSSVKLADADLRKAVATLSETRDAYVPNFIIGSSVGPPSIGFPAGQPSIANASMQSLAFSVQQGQYIRAARVGIQAATLSVKDAREQVALDASAEYIELDTVQREIEATQQQQTFAERLVTIEQQRQEAGVDPMSEFLQARLTAAQLKLRLLHLEARTTSLASQLASLTGLPVASIKTDPASIPEIPQVRADMTAVRTAGLEAAQAEAQSRQYQAHGDQMATKILPLIAFGAQYNRDSTLLNNYSFYYQHFKADNFSAGFSISIPIFDLNHRAKARESAAEALRATVEAEQAQRQNDVQIANLTGSIRELDAQAEIASLKQQIAGEQLKSVEVQLQLGNGAGSEPGAQPQLSPKAEQEARINEKQKAVDAIDAGFDLTKARLSLLHALGHMDDWLHELQTKEPATASQ